MLSTEIEVKNLLTQRVAPELIVVEVKFYHGNARTSNYLVDGKLMLRLSKSILVEVEKLQRVADTIKTPKVHAAGTFEINDATYYYTLIDFVNGLELWDSLSMLSVEQKYQLGVEIAEFLTELHGIKGQAYDIGHYIPTIPSWTGSWQEGHQRYVEYLEKYLPLEQLEILSQAVVKKAFAFIKTNIDVLIYQSGAVMLHNDLHPKNVIIADGQLTGVIDWECSQFGEADFELTNLFQWQIYPPTTARHDLVALLQGVMKNLPSVAKIPHFATRMTIYQLEEELNQLIWHGKSAEVERAKRIQGWLDGKVDELLKRMENY